MHLMNIQKLQFGAWRKWRERPRPSQDRDVPPDFGILGIYILASSETKPGAVDYPSTTNPQEEIVYIGMSGNVDRRLERTHGAVVRYKTMYSDPSCRKLWWSIWCSDWTNMSSRTPAGVLAAATLAAYERGLILAYAQAHKHLPSLNRE